MTLYASLLAVTLLLIYRACTSLQLPELLLDVQTQKSLYAKATVLCALVICELVAGPIIVILNESSKSDETDRNNLNALTIDSLIGSAALFIIFSVWAICMYRCRPAQL